MSSESIGKGGRPRTLDLAVSMALLDYLEERPIAYLEEMRFFLFDAFDISFLDSVDDTYGVLLEGLEDFVRPRLLKVDLGLPLMERIDCVRSRVLK